MVLAPAPQAAGGRAARRAAHPRRGRRRPRRPAVRRGAAVAASPYRVCFVCLGNICRSPTAEAVMRHLLAREGLGGRVQVDSAGTGSWHVGEPPDRRATAEARTRGIVMEGRARRFRAGDFDRFDLVVAMDARNAADLRADAPDAGAAAKVHLLREWDLEARDGDRSVPDPYYGGPEGFGVVLDMVERACAGLIVELREGALAGA